MVWYSVNTMARRESANIKLFGQIFFIFLAMNYPTHFIYFLTFIGASAVVRSVFNPKLNSKRVKKKIECPVCQENFAPKNLRFLECAHPICNTCLQGLRKQECPSCRHQI